MNVLIVDDSELLQIRLKRALLKDDLSMCVSQAYSVKEALMLFHSFIPRIVILDIALPDGSGIELLQTFKKERPEVVVAMLTNFEASEFRQICLAFGADHFYGKPNISGLIQKIKMIEDNENSINHENNFDKQK